MTNEEFLRSITLEGEEWRNVVGWEGYYAVSNLGRVTSLQRIVIDKANRSFRKRGVLLKPFKNRDGYLEVNLKRNSVTHTKYVHRLVAIAFIPNPKPSEYNLVDHINGNILDNAHDNLRWCTIRMNFDFELAKSRHLESVKRKPKGSNKKRTIIGINLSNPNETRIYGSSLSTKKDGFTRQMVGMCLRGKRKSHRGYKWMYLSDYESSCQ